jgi:hypothetical protein
VLDRVGVCAVVSASVGEGEEMLDGLLQLHNRITTNAVPSIFRYAFIPLPPITASCS